MEDGATSTGDDRARELAEEIAGAEGRLIELYEELAAIAPSGEVDGRRLMDIIRGHYDRSVQITRAIAALVIIPDAPAMPSAESPALRPLPAPGPRPVLVKVRPEDRVSVSPEELAALAARFGVWEMDVFDPRFDPALTPRPAVRSRPSTGIGNGAADRHPGSDAAETDGP